jgi:hypothetical protein
VTGDANREALHPPTKASSIVRLDEQVNVIRLHAEMDDANETLPRFANLVKNATEERLAAQGR